MAAIILIEDLHAADLGMPYELGLLYRRGTVIKDPLPEIEALLLVRGKAEVFEGAVKPVKSVKPVGPAKNKRGTGPASTKKK